MKYIIKDPKTGKLFNNLLFSSYEKAKMFLNIDIGKNSYLRNMATGVYGKVNKNALRSLRLAERCIIQKVKLIEVK